MPPERGRRKHIRRISRSNLTNSSIPAFEGREMSLFGRADAAFRRLVGVSSRAASPAVASPPAPRPHPILRTRPGTRARPAAPVG